MKTKEERKNPILKEIEAKRKANGILKPKEIHSIRDKEKYKASKLSKDTDKFVTDLWNLNGKTIFFILIHSW